MDLPATIRHCITKSTTTGDNIFDLLVIEIENYFNRKTNNIQDLKDKYNKKLKGDVWESFCKMYLETRYKRVWFWKDVPEKARAKIGLFDLQDNGIDLVAKDYKSNYYSIQCKYRSKGGKVNWSTLSTFIALSERAKFKKFIVITNCGSITRKIPKTEKDYVIAKGTLRRISLESWQSMVGDYVEHKLSDDVKPKNLDQLREKRLAYFK